VRPHAPALSQVVLGIINSSSCDMHMQPITGLQLLRSVRQDRSPDGTRFLLMRGSVEPSTVIAARQAGAVAYLLKPFTPEQLKGKVEQIFARYHLSSIARLKSAAHGGRTTWLRAF
jgi:two-component system, chemotaxis family, chemotaxis protein CheY